MHYEKNLHAFVPRHFSPGHRKTRPGRSVSVWIELMSDAVEQRLSMRGLEEVLAFGKRHAKERGLKPGDVATAIADERREHPERG